jgi:hypothetical protein
MQAFRSLLYNTCLITYLRFLYLNIVPLCQPFKCFGITILFMLHQESDEYCHFYRSQSIYRFLLMGKR